MNLLTWEQISQQANALCELNVNPSIYLHDIVCLLHDTGARANEIIKNPTLNYFPQMQMLQFMQHKTNQIRYFPATNFDKVNINDISRIIAHCQMYSYSSALRALKKHHKYSPLYVNSKDIEFHIFRHNKIKFLKNSENKTLQEIASFMQISSISTVTHYLYSDIYQ